MKHLFLILTLFLILPACKEINKERITRLMEEWEGKEIKYPTGWSLPVLYPIWWIVVFMLIQSLNGTRYPKLAFYIGNVCFILGFRQQNPSLITLNDLYRIIFAVQV